MAKIMGINTKPIKVLNFLQFNRELDACIEEFGGATELKIDEVYGEFKSSLNGLIDVVDSVEKSVLTEEIKDANRARGEMFRAMVEITNGNTKHYEPDIAKAARELNIYFDDCGNITKKSYKEETAYIVSIVHSMEGTYKERAQKIGIYGLVVQLKARNMEFERLIAARFQERFEKTEGAVKNARLKLTTAYKSVVDMVNALALVDGTEKYDTFINKFNMITSTYKVKPRTTGSSDDEEEEDTEEKYPNAKEYTANYNPNDWKNGDIAWIIKDGKRVYYELIDQRSIDVPPTHEEYAGTWKVLSE